MGYLIKFITIVSTYKSGRAYNIHLKNLNKCVSKSHRKRQDQKYNLKKAKCLTISRTRLQHANNIIKTKNKAKNLKTTKAKKPISILMIYPEKISKISIVENKKPMEGLKR